VTEYNVESYNVELYTNNVEIITFPLLTGRRWTTAHPAPVENVEVNTVTEYNVESYNVELYTNNVQINTFPLLTGRRWTTARPAPVENVEVNTGTEVNTFQPPFQTQVVLTGRYIPTIFTGRHVNTNIFVPTIPQPIPQPLAEKCNSSSQQVLGPLHVKEGTFKYYYAYDDNGNVIYNVYSDQETLENNEVDDSIVTYNYSLINGVATSNFSTMDISENGENEVQVSGCQGWWEHDNVDITNIKNDDTEWFMKNCFVFDPATNEKCSASTVNFSTLRGQSMQYGDWVCDTPQGSFEYDMDTCQWTPAAGGAQSLVEMKPMASIKALIHVKKEVNQNYLAF